MLGSMGRLAKRYIRSRILGEKAEFFREFLRADSSRATPLTFSQRLGSQASLYHVGNPPPRPLGLGKGGGLYNALFCVGMMGQASGQYL